MNRPDGASGFTSRLPWSRLPLPVRHAVEAAVGSQVVGARDVHGGMSPGPAAVLRLDDGRQVFTKMIASGLNERSQDLCRYEIAAYRALAPLEPVLPMPELVAVVQHGPWLGLVTTLAPGAVPGPPWERTAVAVVATGCDVLASHQAPDGVPPVLSLLPDLDAWAALRDDPTARLDGWDLQHVDACARAVRDWRRWTAGSALAHHDVRCDNVLVDPTGPTFVDWAFASAAAPWFDRAVLACDVVGSGVRCEPGAQDDALALALDVLADLPAEAARLVVAQAGVMRRNSTLSAKPGIPGLRSWQAQRAQRLRPLVQALLPQLS